MASKEPHVNSQAVSVKCELCDYDRAARWLCTNCHEKMCLQCKTTHLNSKASNTHKVINIGPPSDVPKISIHCPSHSKEAAINYCITCEVPACVKCTWHQQHNIDNIKNILNKYMTELSDHITKTKLQIHDLHDCLQLVHNNEKSYATEIVNIANHINRRRQEWKSQIDKMADDIIQKLQKLESQELQVLKKQASNISKQISDLKELLKTCEEKMHSPSTDIAIIKFVAEIRKRKDQHESVTTHIPISPPKFVSNDVVKLPMDFGNLETTDNDGKNNDPVENKMVESSTKESTIDTKIIATICPKNSTCISTVTDKEAWCGHGFGSGGNEVKLIHIDGRVIKRVNLDFELYGIAVTSDGKLLLTQWHGHSVKKYTENSQFVNITNTSPFKTRGICTTSDNDILVCLSKDTKQGRILRLTAGGLVKQTIQQNKHKKILFKAPRLVKENVNKDICVVDGHSNLIVVNKDGDLRFNYPDTTPNSNAISRCDGITCDRYGFILISDCYSHQIHQIDRDGKFVQYILTDEHGIEFPWGLSKDKSGQLWICNNNGSEVAVVKFRS